MSTFSSLWSHLSQNHFGSPAAPTKRSSKRRKTSSRQRRFESLERREVFDATFDSVLSFGNDDVAAEHRTRDVETDAAGNSYVSGDFSGTVDFDQLHNHPGDADILTATGPTNGYVAKYAPDDTLIWVVPLGSDVSVRARSLKVDAAGAVYVSGEFTGTAQFGSTTLSTTGAEDQDGFVTKLSAGGVVQWARQFGSMAAGGDFSDAGLAVDTDGAGNVYALAMRYGDGVDVRKYNSSGTLVWTKSAETTISTYRGDMVVNSAGDVYVTGVFNGTVDFDPSSKTKLVSGGAGSLNTFVWKLNKDGKLAWVSPFNSVKLGGQTGQCYPDAISLDASGNVIVGGSYGFNVDFNPGAGTTYLPTGFGGYLTKLNPNTGALTWARALSANHALVTAIDTDSAGNIYAAGYFHSYEKPLDLDPGAGTDHRWSQSQGVSDVFVVKLNSSGNYVWGDTFGGAGTDQAWGISVDTSGAIYIAGYFQNTVDFNTDPLLTANLTSTSSTSGFRLRLRQA